jgi:hypothetical protein
MRPAARGYARRDAFIARVSNSREPHAETAAQDDKQRLAAAAARCRYVGNAITSIAPTRRLRLVRSSSARYARGRAEPDASLRAAGIRGGTIATPRKESSVSRSPHDRFGDEGGARRRRGWMHLLGESASRSATPAIRRGPPLSPVMLAARRIRASDPAVPAVRAEQGPRAEPRDTHAGMKARATAAGDLLPQIPRSGRLDRHPSRARFRGASGSRRCLPRSRPCSSQQARCGCPSGGRLAPI